MAKLKSSRKQHWLHRVLVFLVALCFLTLMVQMSTMSELGSTRLRRAMSLRIPWRHPNKLEELQQEPVADEVSSEDLLHLSLLHERCVVDVDAALPWQFGSPGHQFDNATASNSHVMMHENDTDLLQKLKQCPDVDVYLPNHLHGNGYCEDAVAYAKYLNSRLLPMWVLQKKMHDPELGEVDYFDLCPKTPMIFFNHYWDDVPTMSRWPSNKPIYLMPNIEMVELTPEFYWKVDAVLCKTQVCFDRVTQWYEQEGNPRNAEVFYTKHTSSDQAQFARKRLGEDTIAPKNFSRVKFLHTPGTSIWKGTRHVLDCWTSTADLPPLDVYIGEDAYNYMMPPTFQRRLNFSRSPVNIHMGMSK
ncbi:Homebox and aldo/keto reductase [Phytophthora megakarya]|uniref:Homebox and aldo/keto reductase n=1 Tax=Phytophthora megakarya TaxID=4795 RepID=A0A225V566_9STRA|nr:Homebox and aldo/keto reductase [Phytophthora megakarya]